MKNIFTTLLLSLLAFSIYAQIPGIGQVPMGINYQAVARDAAGELIVNDDVNIRFKILDGSATGTELFMEPHIATTNEFGLFNVVIGSVNTTDFSNIEWRTADRFLKVELFEAGTWTEIGTQQILAVPYATVAGNGKNVNANGFESMSFYGENGTLNAILGRVGVNNGGISFRDDDGETKVLIFSNSSTNAGQLNLTGENGSLNIVASGTNTGGISVRDDNGEARGILSSNANADGASDLILRGSNGSNNVILGFNGTSSNHGRLTIHGINGTQKINLGVNANNTGFINTTGDICANGFVCANIKNFRMDHPTRPDKEIWYACIEGPEAAAYERGTAQLINGEATIQFSEHFELVLNHTTMTVTLTPLDANAKGLAVVEKTATGFKVKELNGGTGNYAFDWRAEGVRRGFEDYEVVRDKAEMQKMLGETPR